MQFNVIAEVEARLTESRADRWIDALIEFSPAIGATNRNGSEIVITVEAKSLSQAIAVGLAVMKDAAGDLFTFTVMPTSEFDRRTDEIEVPELVGAVDAAEILGVTRQRVQQMASSGSLPSTRVGNVMAFSRATVEEIAKDTVVPQR